VTRPEAEAEAGAVRTQGGGRAESEVPMRRTGLLEAQTLNCVTLQLIAADAHLAPGRSRGDGRKFARLQKLDTTTLRR